MPCRRLPPPPPKVVMGDSCWEEDPMSRGMEGGGGTTLEYTENGLVPSLRPSAMSGVTARITPLVSALELNADLGLVALRGSIGSCGSSRGGLGCPRT